MVIGSFAIPVQDTVTADFLKECSETSENCKGKHPLSRLALKQYSFLIYEGAFKLCLKGHCNEAFTIKNKRVFASFKKHKNIRKKTFTTSKR